MGDKIGIMGAGALGSYVGAFLSKIGEDVTFVDMWPEHVAKMQKDGLHVTGSQGPFTVPVKAMHLTDAQKISEPFDFAFISVKSYDTEWATHFVKRYVRNDGFFISLQNCWNDVTMGEIVGPTRQIGCIASHIEVALWEPGLVTRGGAVGRDSGHHVFRVAEQDGRITPRAEKVAALLDNIDGAYASDNLWGERWAKLCQNSMGEWALRRHWIGLATDGRRPALPDDPHQPVQGRRESRSGHGPECGQRPGSTRPNLGRRRQGRRVRGIGRDFVFPRRQGQLAGVYGPGRV